MLPSLSPISFLKVVSGGILRVNPISSMVCCSQLSIGFEFSSVDNCFPLFGLFNVTKAIPITPKITKVATTKTFLFIIFIIHLLYHLTAYINVTITNKEILALYNPKSSLYNRRNNYTRLTL